MCLWDRKVFVIYNSVIQWQSRPVSSALYLPKCRLSYVVFLGPSWPWSYGSWIYNTMNHTPIWSSSYNFLYLLQTSFIQIYDFLYLHIHVVKLFILDFLLKKNAVLQNWYLGDWLTNIVSLLKWVISIEHHLCKTIIVHY